MKQTQTKFYAFSDADLDLSSASRAKMPGAFKKVLNTGYNVKTVSSVIVVGNQVTFNYAAAHGYVEHRVLKVNSPDLSTINGGEFVIDSVTTTSVTMTIDDAPSSIAGGFETKVAPLGWDLVYELDLVYLYKMRYLDERELYIRFVFAPSSGTHKSTANVCIGKTANESTGEITDNTAAWGKTNVTPEVGLQWMFANNVALANVNNTYAQGASNAGDFFIVGSMYHLICMCNSYSTSYPGRFFAILPTHTYGYDSLDYPLLLGMYSTVAMSTINGRDNVQFNAWSANPYSHAYVGNVAVAFNIETLLSTTSIIEANTANISSFFPDSIESFNTFAALPIFIYERSTRQFIGMVSGGAYRAEIKSEDLVTVTVANIPKITQDSEGVLIPLQLTWSAELNANIHCFCAPLEEIKVVS